jgi:preprotein translocase subunit SecE
LSGFKSWKKGKSIVTETKVEKRSGAVKKAAPDKKPASETHPLIRYFRETRGELRKVTWPTRAESQRLTMIVLGVTAVMAIFLGILDFLFSTVIQSLVSLVAGVSF